MPAFHIQRSSVINASREAVFDAIADYGTWPTWSPWLGIDADAKVTTSDEPASVGGNYQWSGPVVGAGSMKHLKLDRPSSTEDQLRFIKPFKSVSSVRFDIEPAGNETRVTWHMDGKLPWFLFFMKSSMETFVGMDYERGLSMLKEFVETGAVASKLEVMGEESVSSKRLIGVQASSSLDEIGVAMGRALEQVTSALDTDSPPGQLMSCYLASSDMKQRRFDFISGFEHPDSVVPSGLICHEIPKARYLRIRHTGRYEHLGNAWSGGYQYARAHKMKIAKREGLEVYVNNPSNTAPEDLITDIYLPL
ncbi:MAG: SRPBCC family protein [Planctomycetota bacterium]